MSRKLCWVGISLFIICVCTAQAESRKYDDYVVLRVEITSDADVETLRALGDVWAVDPMRGTADVMLMSSRVSDFEKLGLRFHVMIEDVQKKIDSVQMQIEAQRVIAGGDWFDNYHPFDEIMTYVTNLANAHPTMAEMITIGSSLEGRSIQALHIASPDLHEFSPAVIYFCNVHAREWITTTVVPYFGNYLLENYGTDPQVTDLLDHVEIFLVPVGNPDGLVFSWTEDRMWRKNRRDNGDGEFGVDINRNWGYFWGLDEGSSGRTYSGIYRGPEPFSEPETRALRDLFLANPNVRAMNDIHSYTQKILYPWGFTADLPPDNATYSELGTAMEQLIFDVHGKEYEAGPTYTTIYEVSGDSADWTYGVRNIYSFSFELRDTGVHGFLLPPEQIIPNNEEILPALLYLTGSDVVYDTQINFTHEKPTDHVTGETATFRVAVTSAVETIDGSSPTFHYRMYPDEPFVSLPMTALGDVEYEAVLPAGNCAAEPEFYFSVIGSTGTTTEPAGAPAETYQLTMRSGRTIYYEPFDTDPGWTTEGLWAFGQPTGEGGTHGDPDPEEGRTGTNVYGYNLNGDYENSLPEQHLTSTAYDCTGKFGVHLSFWRWLGVEAMPYDRAALSISTNGTDWTLVWENGVTIEDDEWIFQDFDISDYADDQPTVYFRWTMGPTDSGWAYCGWNIDDLELYATECVGMPGDINGDRLLGLSDLQDLADCIGGPGSAVGLRCEIFDFDSDGNVDLEDAAVFQYAFTGD